MTLLKQKSIRPAILIILLFMILSRLTWLQLRHYTIEPLGFLGPNLFGLVNLEMNEVRTWNINVILVLFFLAAHMIRCLTRYWFTALFATTVLMSRGSVLARVGWDSFDLSLSMLAVGWFACLAHYLVTASIFSRVGSWFFLILGSLLEPSFSALALLLPIFRYNIIRRSPQEKTLQQIPRGSLLRPLPLSFENWLEQRTDPFKESKQEILAFVFLSLAIFYFKDRYTVFHSQSLHENTIYAFLDLHYLGSFLLVLGSAIYGWKKRNTFLSFQKIFLVSILVWSLSSIAWHFISGRPIFFKAILLWLEPILLCLACSCIIFIIQDLKEYWSTQRWSKRASCIKNEVKNI